MCVAHDPKSIPPSIPPISSGNLLLVDCCIEPTCCCVDSPPIQPFGSRCQCAKTQIDRLIVVCRKLTSPDEPQSTYKKVGSGEFPMKSKLSPTYHIATDGRGKGCFGLGPSIPTSIDLQVISINTITMTGDDARPDQYLLTSGTGISHHRSRCRRAYACIEYIYACLPAIVD